MLEDMQGLLQAADDKRQAAITELSAKHQKVKMNADTLDTKFCASAVSFCQIKKLYHSFLLYFDSFSAIWEFESPTKWIISNATETISVL